MIDIRTAPGGATNTCRGPNPPTLVRSVRAVPQSTYTQSELKAEVWRDVPGWEGFYQASSLGRIRSVDRKLIYPNGKEYSRKGKVKSTSLSNSGYFTVPLSRHDRSISKTVHSLVLSTFVGPRPDGYQACHNDGNRTNNRVENLRWDTIKANHADKKKHGTNGRKKATHCKHGHAFTEENTRYVRESNGSVSRLCKICVSEYRRKLYYENLEESRRYARARYKEKYAIPKELHKPNITDLHAAQTHCKRGHELTEPNITPASKKSGHRTCRACANGMAYIRRHPGMEKKEQEIVDRYFEKIMQD